MPMASIQVEPLDIPVSQAGCKPVEPAGYKLVELVELVEHTYRTLPAVRSYLAFPALPWIVATNRPHPFHLAL